VLAPGAEPRRCSPPRVRAELRLRPAGACGWNGKRLGMGLGVGVWPVGWLILFVGPDGPSGLLGLVPAHASCWVFSCRVGPTLWAEIVAQHSPMSCSCRPRPEIIVLGSCSCRTKNSCFGPTHGPRAIWPSISAATTAPRHLETHKIRILLDRLHLPGTIPWLHLDIRCLPTTPCNGGQ
jgi:hypothetical protein